MQILGKKTPIRQMMQFYFNSIHHDEKNNKILKQLCEIKQTQKNEMRGYQNIPKMK
jgi:hypothetical protein